MHPPQRVVFELMCRAADTSVMRASRGAADDLGQGQGSWRSRAAEVPLSGVAAHDLGADPFDGQTGDDRTGSGRRVT